MSLAENKAVFLSYASQDAEAARRICEALRAAGLEVWFDQSELRGGDAWDQKIRRQIKECALFMPVISATTQARPEGYFRLEWKLAVDRSHLMADDAPFLFPVVIDDTPEPAARVPDRFRDVQWTRLDLRETPAGLAVRIAKLLDGEIEPGRRRPGESGERAASSRGNRAGWRWWMVFPVASMLMGLGYAVLPLWHAFNRPARPAAKPVPAKVEPPAPVSEARALLAKARALYEPWEGATRQDFVLAEDLMKRATVLDPADAEVWAAYAVVATGQILLAHDRSPARIERARANAERAVKLAPDSRQARFAQACTFRFQSATRGEAERALRQLVEEGPDDGLMLRMYAAVLRGLGKDDEALRFLDRAAALPGGAPAAAFNKYLVFSATQRLAEAEAVLDAAIAAHPTPYLYGAKVSTLTVQHGDLDGAAQVLAKVSGAYLLEDPGAYAASQLWLWRREPDKAASVWRAVTRDLIECAEFRGPKAFLIGQAHRMAGRAAAAEAEWKAALSLVERELAAQPSALHWVYWRVRLLASLGCTEEATSGLRTFEELSGAKGLSNDSIPIYLLLGRKDEVIAALEKSHATLAAHSNPTLVKAFVNNLRLNHEWDPLREEPRFAALLKPTEAKQ